MMWKVGVALCVAVCAFIIVGSISESQKITREHSTYARTA